LESGPYRGPKVQTRLESGPFRDSITYNGPKVQTRLESEHFSGPKVQTRLESGPFRDSITWKNQGRPQMLQQQEQQYQPMTNKRIGYDSNYREEPKMTNQQRYFPSQNNNNYYSTHYNHDRIQTVTSEPRRNYFPVPDEEIIEDNYSDEYLPNFDPYAEHESFIGEEQVLNAGYTVQDGNMKPHEYLTSSYERPDKVDLSEWYDLTVIPTMKPMRATTVKPWTSIDLAKPDWEETSPNLFDDQAKSQKLGLQTYGSWNKDTLKLGAVPFSRATDGKERKWVKVSSVKRKRKRIPPNTKEILLDTNLGMKVDQ